MRVSHIIDQIAQNLFDTDDLNRSNQVKWTTATEERREEYRQRVRRAMPSDLLRFITGERDATPRELIFLLRGNLRALDAVRYALSEMNATHRAHPRRPRPMQSPTKQWAKIEQDYFRRRSALLKKLRELEDERRHINARFSDQPVSTLTLGTIIDRMVHVENAFHDVGPDEAWDQISGIIDYLESEESRVVPIQSDSV